MASLIRCPICETQFDPQTSTAVPFCGERCRRIDLGRWLREAYRLPVEPSSDEEPSPDFSDEYD